MAKPYGLILPGQHKVSEPIAKRPKIFDSDSGSEPETERTVGLSTTLKRQHKVAQQRAVQEDPTVYQYDELYDDITAKRKESKLARSDLDRKPKYMAKLLETADKRKKENERRQERQIQKDREAEGDEFKDKESFVTSGYRKKLEEMKEMEEQDRREAYLEKIGDVTKQPDLGGFYRHLYEQKLNSDNSDDQEDKKPEIPDKQPEKAKPASRSYRRREDDHSSAEDEPVTKADHIASNLDADSDFSIDSDSEDESDKEPEPKQFPPQAEVVEEKPAEKPPAEPIISVKTEKEEEIAENPTITESPVEVKEKIDIWKKRTVGPVFDAALQRYFQRKAAREKSL